MVNGNDASAFGALLRHPMFRPVALGLSAVFVLASVVLVIWQIERNSNAVAASSTSAGSSQIAAYVVGAVNHPGVYHLPATARACKISSRQLAARCPRPIWCASTWQRHYSTAKKCMCQ
jgi:hypothetical protein